MKLRPDLVSMVLTGLAVVAITALAAFHVPIPDVLTFVAIGALGIGGGTALNTTGTGAVDAASQRITDALSSVETLVSDLRAGRFTAAAADAARVATAAAAVRAGASSAAAATRTQTGDPIPPPIPAPIPAPAPAQESPAFLRHLSEAQAVSQ